MKRNHKTTFSF